MGQGHDAGVGIAIDRFDSGDRPCAEEVEQCLRDKRADTLRLTRLTHQVHLGMPAITAAG